MDLNLNKCPECGYENYEQPDVCPMCGCDLAAHRDKIYAEIERQRKVEENLAEQRRMEDNYKSAIQLFNNADFHAALTAFSALGEYSDSKDYVEKCHENIYLKAISVFSTNLGLTALFARMNQADPEKSLESGISDADLESRLSKWKEKEYDDLAASFCQMNGYKRSEDYAACCKKAIECLHTMQNRVKYAEAIALYEKGEFPDAKKIFKTLKDFEDAEEYLGKCIDAIKRKEQEETDAEEKRIKKEKLIDTVEKVLQTIAIFLPIVLSVVFGIFLFGSIKQLSFYGLFALLTVAWIVLVIFAIVMIIIYFNTREQYGSNKSKRILAGIIAGLMIVISVLVFANVSKLEKGFGPDSIIEFRVDSKENDYSFGNYQTTIHFTMTNKTNREITEVWAEIEIYDAAGKIGTYSIQWDGAFTVGENRLSATISSVPNRISAASLGSLTFKIGVTRIYAEKNGGVSFNDAPEVKVSVAA